MTASVLQLRSQYPHGLLGVPSHGLRLHWTATGAGVAQEAYQLRWSTGFGEVPDHVVEGPVTEGAQTHDVPAPGGALASGERRTYAVRIRDLGAWSPWSDVLEVEGELHAVDLSAQAIGADTLLAGPALLLRTEFDLPADIARARLRATSHGIHDLHINGAHATGDHLSPGWTPYHSRLLVGTWDVTELLVPGSNALGGVLGDGWYRGRLGANDEAEHYGSQLSLWAQLDVDLADGTTVRVATDPTWRVGTGAVRTQSLYDGTAIDLRLDPTGWDRAGFDDRSWVAAAPRSIDRSTLRARSAGGVRTVAELPMRVVPTSPGCVLDAGQNIAGWVRLTVRGHAGDVVTIRHAEVLEPDGTLHTRALRGARATDCFVLDRDGDHVLEPQLTFHGFRYAEVAGTQVLTATAVAISSAHGERSSFACSEPLLERFHQNVLWSLRDNFLSLPTDCPQRDERLGWTGDAQAFTPASGVLVDTEAFWGSWLQDLALEQSDQHGVPAVVPNVLPPFEAVVDGVPQLTMGRSGWGDAAVVVPWAVHEAFGGTEVLERQLDSMRRWVDHLVRRAGDDVLLPEEFQFGDWLDPDAPADRPWLGKTPAAFVANSFFAHSAALLAKTEDLVGDPSRAARARELHAELSRRTWRTWGAQASRTQTGCALALRFAVCPTGERPFLQSRLADLVREAGGRIAAGFLGTPHLLHALSDGGYVDEAYHMLLCRQAPSWLYQVDRGATTVWERWDALLPDGSIHPGDFSGGGEHGGSMLSFNHYAYGAAIDWVYRHVAGIAPTSDDPGYRTVVVAPRPASAITWARARISSRFGVVAVDWSLSPDEDALHIHLEVPYSSRAHLDLPVTEDSVLLVDGAPFSGSELSAGTHHLHVTAPRIARQIAEN